MSQKYLSSQMREHGGERSRRRGMERVHGEAGIPVRRFVVTAGILPVRDEVYSVGDVLTDFVLGADTAWLLSQGAVVEGDFDLYALFDDLDAAPRE